MLIAGGTGAVNAVLLASAVVPPIIVLLVIRVAWVWAKSHDEDQPMTLRQLLRKALWLDRRETGTA